MVEFRSIDDYFEYIKNKSFLELNDIINGINKTKYPDRYKLLCEVIKQKEIEYKSQQIDITKKEDKSKPVNHINIIRIIHIVLIMLGIIAVFLNALNIYTPKNSISIVEAIIGIVVSVSIVYGIKNRKEWVVLLVMIHSYIKLTGIIVYALSIKTDLTLYSAIVNAIGNIIILIYLCYQIFIFTRLKTKEYFKCADNELI